MSDAEYARWLNGWLNVGEARREPCLGADGTYRMPYEPDLIRRILIDEREQGFSLLDRCTLPFYYPPSRFYIFRARGVWRRIKVWIRWVREGLVAWAY